MVRQAVVKEGHFIIRRVFEASELATLARDFANTSLRRSRAGIRHALHDPAVARFVQDIRLLKIAEEVLGGRAIPFRATLFDKSAASNWLVAWHQDTALPLTERREKKGWGPWSVKDGVLFARAPAMALENIVALRVHLDDSLKENGPLRVLSGTHRSGILSSSEVDRLSHSLEAEDCVVPMGGVLAMRPLLLHASSKAISRAQRRVLHVEYTERLEIAPGFHLAKA